MIHVNRDPKTSGAATQEQKMNSFNIVINGITRTCSIVKRQKNGRVVISAEAIYNGGRRLYAAQRFVVEASEVVAR